MARERRNYTDEFKKKIVELYNSGIPRAELVREYELTPSALSSWINKYNNSGSFKAENNRTPEENELIEVGNVKFSVESIDKNRINKIRIFV